MEWISEYFWHLLILGAHLAVMRWVVLAIATVIPPRMTMTQSQGPADDSPPVRDAEEVQATSRAVGMERAIPQLPQLSDEPSGGRRMATAWAHRCRLLSVDQNTDVQTAARCLLTSPSYGGLLVIDNQSNDIIGILQKRDLVQALGEYGARAGSMRVGQLVRP